METKQSWYAPKSSNHQGVIVSEGDGRTVAVAYDKADAPLIAAAPELLEVVNRMLETPEPMTRTEHFEYSAETTRLARAAISKAKGEA